MGSVKKFIKKFIPLRTVTYENRQKKMENRLGQIEETQRRISDELRALNEKSDRAEESAAGRIQEFEEGIAAKLDGLSGKDDGIATEIALLHAKTREIQGGLQKLCSSNQVKTLEALKGDIATLKKREKVLEDIVSSQTKRQREMQHVFESSISTCRKRAYLEHLDYHVVDHCNLNCRHCSTFSPIAKDSFADVDEFADDLRRFHALVGDRVIRLHLLGGEPLLHPRIDEFVRISREVFPEARIDVTTNGLLTFKMPDSFWSALKECSVDFKYTQYPIKFDYGEMVSFVKSKGIRAFSAREGEIKTFRYTPLNADGVFNTQKMYMRCPYVDCAQIKTGKLYHCPQTAYVETINMRLEHEGLASRFHRSSIDFLDLSAVESAEEVFEFLSNPVPFCSYCDINRTENVPWGTSDKSVGEWVDMTSL